MWPKLVSYLFSNLKVHPHQAKAKKIKGQAKNNQRINGKHQRKFSILLGLNTAKAKQKYQLGKLRVLKENSIGVIFAVLSGECNDCCGDGDAASSTCLSGKHTRAQLQCIRFHLPTVCSQEEIHHRATRRDTTTRWRANPPVVQCRTVPVYHVEKPPTAISSPVHYVSMLLINLWDFMGNFWDSV